MAPVPAFVINLDGSDARLAEARAQLDAAGLAFQRVPAFDGRGLTRDQFPGYDHARAMAYMGRPLRGGEIGCYLSHLEAARHVVASGAPYGLVFEDDIQLLPHAAAGIRAVLDWLDAHPRDWDVVNIGANRHRIFTPLADLAVEGADFQLTLAHYFPMMACALIWSRAGARAFVDGHRTIWAPVDNYFRHWQTRADRGLAVWPPLVTTSGAESEIADQGANRRSVEGRRRFYGLAKQRRLLTDKLIAYRHKLSAR